MKKLTAEVCRQHIDRLTDGGEQNGRSLREDDYLQALEIALPVLEQQEKGDDGWIDWKGGDIPVDRGAQVELRWSSVMTDKGRASSFSWENRTAQGVESIIAYRVIENDGREG